MHPYNRQNTTFTSLIEGCEALFTAPYRFSFNGQERTDETAGTGNHNTALYWEYDTRLGRRWNVDSVDFPWQSPYSVFKNNPILFADPLGLYGTKEKAQREHDRAVKKYGKESVSEVYYNPDKEEFAFLLFDQGENKNVKVKNENGIADISADKGTAINSKRDPKEFENSFIGNSDLHNWISNLRTATRLTFDWMHGLGRDDYRFINSPAAYAFRNSRFVIQARKFWYDQINSGNKRIIDGVTDFRRRRVWTGGYFGFKVYIRAGLDPLEQFVGSFTPEIKSDGHTLTFTIVNTTSLKSLLYGIAPDYRRSTFKPGGIMTQTYIFSEPIDFNRIK